MLKIEAVWAQPLAVTACKFVISLRHPHCSQTSCSPVKTTPTRASKNPVAVLVELVRHGERGLIGSRPYDPTSDENRAYFRKLRFAFVVLVALDNGDPVFASINRKLGSRGECSV